MAVTKVVGWVNTAIVVVRMPDNSIKSVLVNVAPKIALSGTGANFDLASRGDWVLQLDGDLQNPPEEIPKLLAQRAGVRRGDRGRDGSSASRRWPRDSGRGDLGSDPERHRQRSQDPG